MKDKHTFTLTSLNKLLDAFRSGSESRRRINIDGKTGLIANRKGTKSTGPYIDFTYTYRNNLTGKMVYIPIGKYENTKSNLNEIEKLWMSAKTTKHALPKVPQPKYTPPSIANVEQGMATPLHLSFMAWRNTEFIKFSESTKTYYSRHLKSLIQAFPNINTHEVTELHIMDIVISIKNSAFENSTSKRPNLANKLKELSGNSSANQAIATFKVFFDWCIKKEWCHSNPTRHIEKLPMNDNTRAGLDISNPDDVSSLSSYLQHIAYTPEEHDNPSHPDYLRTPCTQKKRLYRLMLYTGMRAGEWRLMRVRDINFISPNYTKAIVTIPRGRAKARKTVQIPLSVTATSIVHEQMNCTGYKEPDDLIFPREAQKYFMRSPHNRNLNYTVNNEPYKDSAIPQLHERLCKDCGIDYFKPHGLRHMFITTAALLGVDELTQRRLTSHSDGQKDAHSKHYNHFNYLDDMKEASSRIATFFNYFTLSNPDNFGDNSDFDDLLASSDYWLSNKGRRVTVKYKIDIDLYDILLSENEDESMPEAYSKAVEEMIKLMGRDRALALISASSKG
tara:strand:- start:29093 stop:30775 length:1683 start_codon:yes stop_codon:yes gene_type:complete